MKIRVIRKSVLIVALCWATAGTSPLALAGSPVGATEFTQIANNSELIAQGAQQYQQLQQVIQQVQMERQQLQNLVAAPQMVWGQAQSDLQNLSQLVSKGQALGYSLGNLDQLLSSRFPGYNAISQRGNYQAQTKDWLQTNIDSIGRALRAAGFQDSQFATENSRMNTIQGMAASAPGQLQAAQAGIMVASEQVSQLQKLRQLYAEQMQAQNAYMLTQTQAQANDQNTQDSHFVKYQGSAPSFSSSGGKR